ncbi:MAG: helix-turn-helix transcriptional regulator [Planctomycetota bacterium]
MTREDDSLDLPDDTFEPYQQWGPEVDDPDDGSEQCVLGVELTAIEGFKAKTQLPLEAVPASETIAPRSWKEVWGHMHQSFRSLLVRLFDLPLQTVETFHDGLKGVRGLLRLPMAVGEALTRGREKAVAKEEESQRKHEEESLQKKSTEKDAGTDQVSTEEKALNEIEEIVLNLQSQGVALRIERLPGGQYMFAAVRPAVADETIAIASEAVARLTDASTTKLDSNSSGVSTDGERLRELRLKNGLSQAEVAAKCGVSPSTLSRIERGKSQYVSQRVADALSEFFASVESRDG